MILRLLQKHGHRPIVLLGGGTTLIGDPSGKDSTRKILKKKDIKKNISEIKKLFVKLLNVKNNVFHWTQFPYLYLLNVTTVSLTILNKREF